MHEANPNNLAARANTLYWETSRPAGELADELGISRSKFYALIEPRQLVESCEVCDGPLVLSSRTDRQAGRGRCARCGATADVDSRKVVVAETVPSEEPATDLAPESGDGFRAGAILRRTVAGPESRNLWVIAACGAVVGLLTAAWVRRR